MKIGICSLTIGEEYKKVTRRGTQTKLKYCLKHGYDFIDQEKVYDSTRPFSWSKILLVKKYLPRYDYIVWLDGDTMIFNHDKTIEDFISKFMGDKEFMVATDTGGYKNLGVFFVKNTSYMNSLLEKIYSQTEFINDDYWEQSAFEHLYKTLPELPEKCAVLPKEQRNEFNCEMYIFKQGDFLMHFMGIHKAEWLSRVMEDQYPFQKEGEPAHVYQGRLEWFNKRYPN